MSDAPIGIFDSGSGGLSVYRTLASEFPDESFVYVGDHAYLPYAGKTATMIQNRTVRLIEFLLSCDVKAIVIACNTATVAGIELYRLRFPGIPIIGVVPVIKTAAEKTKSNKILVLSTPFTARSAYQKHLIKTFAADKIVYSVGCPKLVPLIESGTVSGKEIEAELKNTILKYMQKGIDVIVLGCTHYPFLLPCIHDIIRTSEISLLDSSGAVMRQLKRVIERNGLTAPATAAREDIFYTTGDGEKTTKVASLLLQKNVYFQHVTL
jgi:glutamate racemase